MRPRPCGRGGPVIVVSGPARRVAFSLCVALCSPRPPPHAAFHRLAAPFGYFNTPPEGTVENASNISCRPLLPPTVIGGPMWRPHIVRAKCSPGQLPLRAGDHLLIDTKNRRRFASGNPATGRTSKAKFKTSNVKRAAPRNARPHNTCKATLRLRESSALPTLPQWR